MTGSASIVVTLDVGGSATKASAVDTATGICLGSTAVLYPASSGALDAGQFDPEAWWRSALRALGGLSTQLAEPPGRYLGITVSAVRIPFVLVDRRGEVVTPALLNGDRRAATELAGLAAECGADEIYRLTGHWLAPEFGLPKLLWTRRGQPTAWHATRSVLQLHDWFIFKLCGQVVSERSAAGMSQCLDVAGRGWADGMLEALGIPVSLLPELQPAGTRAGGLLPAVGRATGLAAGTPVHLGGGDTHMSAESAAPASPVGAVPVVVAGTTTPAQLVVADLDFASRASALYPLLLSEHIIAGRWALETNAGQTGGVVQRLAGLGGLDDTSAAVGTPVAGGALTDELTRRGFAVCADPTADLTVLAGNPWFGPDGWSASPPPSVIGLTSRHTGADVVQACLRATCYSIRSILGCLIEHAGVSPSHIVATGGMSRNARWAQLLADITRHKVVVRPLDQIAGRAGAALVAGGTLPGPSADQRHPVTEEVFVPNTDDAAAHAAGFARYQELYQQAQLEASSGRTVTG